VSGISASARLRSGGSVETTTTVGEYIEVTFDNLGQPILGTWQ